MYTVASMTYARSIPDDLAGTDAAVDTVQSFFESVHHLKDWLGNDPSSGVTKADGDSLINGSQVLRLCADLANGSKHLKLTGSRTGDRSTTIARNDVTVFAGTGTLMSDSRAAGAALTVNVAADRHVEGLLDASVAVQHVRGPRGPSAGRSP